MSNTDLTTAVYENRIRELENRVVDLQFERDRYRGLALSLSRECAAFLDSYDDMQDADSFYGGVIELIESFKASYQDVTEFNLDIL